MDILKNMIIAWNPAKNEILKEQRGVDFNNVLIGIMENRVLDVVTHVNKDKYPNQSMMIIEIDNYIYVDPFVIEGDKMLFLKTIYPSRRATAQYVDKTEGHNDEKKINSIILTAKKRKLWRPLIKVHSLQLKTKIK